MAYERGKIFVTYLKPNWGNFACLRGMRIMSKIADAYDLCASAEEISEGEYSYSLAEMAPECKAVLLTAIQTLYDDLNSLE